MEQDNGEQKKVSAGVLHELWVGTKKFLILFFSIIGAVVALVCIGLFFGAGESSTPPQVAYEQMEISVTSQNIKQVDGKYRYFFNIKNNDDKSFVGDINIDLISAEGNSIYGKDFKDASIDAGIGKNIYIDANTGPVQVHGANGISSFEFTASKEGQVIKSGNGSIIAQ